MGHVLVGVDGSPASEIALRWAADFATSTRRELHLGCAWQQRRELGGPLADARGSDAAAFESAIEERLVALAATVLEDTDVVTACHALRGGGAEALAKEAARSGADLIVVGSAGTGRARRAFLGSVSRSLTECPARAVAVVPQPDDGEDADRPSPDRRRETAAGTAVVGVDGSAGSSRAVRWAGVSARRSGGDVVVVHAFEPPLADASPAETASLAGEARERLEQEWCAPLRMLGVSHEALLEHGDPRRVVAKVADAVRPSYVVVGSRGLGPISQQLLGSVTHHLVRHLDWPTVIVPSPRECAVWTP